MVEEMMGTLTAPEIREYNLSPKERAQARDCFVREFERQWADWVSIAKVCLEVERDRDYELLGFHSWHAWLLAAAPRSRSYIYLVVGRFKELSGDFPEEELADIPLGTAGVIQHQLKSPSVRHDPKVREAAKQKRAPFIKAVRELHPEQHLEDCDPRPLNFTTSQAAVFDEMLECYRAMNNHEASTEEAVEYLCAGWLDGPWEDSGYSNRERAAQLVNYDQERRADDPERPGLLSSADAGLR